MKINWRNTKSSQTAIEMLENGEITFTDLLKGCKETSSLWLFFQDTKTSTQLYEDYVTAKTFKEALSELVKDSQTAHDLDDLISLIKLRTDRSLDYVDLFKYLVENSITSLKEATRLFNISGKLPKVLEDGQIPLEEIDEEILNDMIKNLNASSELRLFFRDDWKMLRRLLDETNISFKTFLTNARLGDSDAVHDMLDSGDFRHYLMTSPKSKSLINDIFDSVHNSRELNEFDARDLFVFIIKNDIIPIKDLVDKYQSISDSNSSSYYYWFLNNDKYFADLLNADVKISNEDLQYILQRALADKTPSAVEQNLSELTGNSALMRYFLKADIFNLMTGKKKEDEQKTFSPSFTDEQTETINATLDSLSLSEADRQEVLNALYNSKDYNALAQKQAEIEAEKAKLQLESIRRLEKFKDLVENRLISQYSIDQLKELITGEPSEPVAVRKGRRYRK